MRCWCSEPPTRDVQYLETPADRQHGNAARDRDVREGGLEIVGPAVDAVHGRVWRFAEQRRIDVGATGEHERVHTCEQFFGVARVVDEYGLSAGALDRVEVCTG